MPMTPQGQSRRDEVRRAIHTHLCKEIITSSIPASPSDCVEVIMAIIAPDLAEADNLRRQLEEARNPMVCVSEIENVRKDIARTASVVESLSASIDRSSQMEVAEFHSQRLRLINLLDSERALMAPGQGG